MKISYRDLEREFYDALYPTPTAEDRKLFAEDQRRRDEGFAELNAQREAYRARRRKAPGG